VSILIGRDTRLLVQGITGREGEFHARAMQAYGTNVVAGVTPGKGGQSALDGTVPVFDTVADAVRDVERQLERADLVAAPRVSLTPEVVYLYRESPKPPPTPVPAAAP